MSAIEQDCWVWNGPRDKHGYGQRTIDYRRSYTHRLAYVWANGPIPDGLQVCHRCDNPPCCNPSHLFLGTQHDNIEDMIKKRRHYQHRKTHCPSGHPYAGDNLWVRQDGTRICRACKAAHGADRHRRKREEINAKHRAYYHRRKSQ